jgi:hypothetical protein
MTDGFPQANSTIPRQYRAVSSPVQPDASGPFLFFQQCNSFGSGHGGEIVDVPSALKTEAHTIIARHGVPVNRAR